MRNETVRCVLFFIPEQLVYNCVVYYFNCLQNVIYFSSAASLSFSLSNIFKHLEQTSPHHQLHHQHFHHTSIVLISNRIYNSVDKQLRVLISNRDQLGGWLMSHLSGCWWFWKIHFQIQTEPKFYCKICFLQKWAITMSQS